MPTRTAEHTCPYSPTSTRAALSRLGLGGIRSSVIFTISFFSVKLWLPLLWKAQSERGACRPLRAQGCERLWGTPGSHALVCESVPRGAPHKLFNNR